MKKGGKLEWFLNQISDLLSADSGVLVPPTLSIVEFNGTFFSISIHSKDCCVCPRLWTTYYRHIVYNHKIE